MKRLLNTLYITSDDAYIKRHGDSIKVEVPDKKPFVAPVHLFDSIVQFGYLGASPGAIGLCCERGVTITFVSRSGRFLGRVEGPVRGNVLLRRAQYRKSDYENQRSTIAPNIVAAKIANSRAVLMRGRRDSRERVGVDFDFAIDSLGRIGQAVLDEHRLDVVRGYEGDAAQVYFGCFTKLIACQEDYFFFEGRSRRPPRDPVNALLSYVYTLLAHECRSALESVGLDPAVGFLHRDRPGRHSLALDLAEEFRAYLGDRFVLSLINRRQVSPKDFSARENGAVVMSDDLRGSIIQSWQKRKQESIQHPWIGERVPLGLLPYVQAQLLGKHLRGELDTYPAFIWR